MSEHKNLLRYGLGGVTVLAILAAVFLAFGSWNGPAAGSGGSATVDALQAENASLRQTVGQLQQREAEYRLQIEAANATIEQLLGGSDLSAAAGQGQLDGVPREPGFFGLPSDGRGHGEHSREYEHSEG